MQYLVISFSHKNTDMALREKLSFDEETNNALLDELVDSRIIKEAILLSTCNRMELMMIVEDIHEAVQKCFVVLSDISKTTKDELEGRADTFEGYSAIHHIFLVASSLDSLIVGETQISGQLKKAYRFALHNYYCTNKGLGNVIDFAFKCASVIRNETGISKKPISIASVAVCVSNNIPLQYKKAVVIGIGEMGRLAIKHLLNAGFSVILLNRNKQKALDFKEELNNPNLEIGNFSDLVEVVNEYELLFSATASPVPIITRDMIYDVKFKRYFFDIALPRDIEDLSGFDIDVRSIDDLQYIVDENIGHRKDAINTAYEIVGNQVNDFFKLLHILSVEPIIKTLRQLAKDVSINEINKAIQKGFLPESYRKNIEKTIHNVFNAFLHTPTKNIKKISSSAQIEEIERTLKMLFSISDENVEEAEKKHDIDVMKGNK